MSNAPGAALELAQLRAFRDRLRNGGRVLSAKELRWAFSDAERALLESEVAEARQRSRDLSVGLHRLDDDADEYWQLALKARQLTVRVGVAPKPGRPRSKWEARKTAAFVAQERASEIWGILPRTAQNLFEEPPEGGWPPDREVWCDMEFPLPMPPASNSWREDVPRDQQLNAIEQRMAACTPETREPVAPAVRRWLESKLRGRLSDG